MSGVTAARVKFRIEPCEDGWIWATRDVTGGERQRGKTPTRELAAALVLRDIVRAAEATLPAGVEPR